MMLLGKSFKEFKSEKYVDSTSNRMELRAIITALNKCKPWRRIDVYSDCEYAITCCQNLHQWIRDGSIKKRANIDILRLLYKALKRHQGVSTIRFVWIRGHAGNNWNERAHQLAFSAWLGGKPTVCKKSSE